MVRRLRFSGVLGFTGLCAVLVSAAGCGGDNEQPATPDAAIDAPPGDAPVDAMPDGPPQAPPTLIDTGLCSDGPCAQISPGIRTYVPRWQLWTDGATKKRWISLPPSTKINNSKPDRWEFPVGTKIWKEFALGGVRVETRYMVKLAEGPSGWFMISYAWNQAQNQALPVPSGREDANGTTHDIPPRIECRQCHERIDGRVLGFSALALDFAGATGDLDLDDVIGLGWLTNAVPGAASPHYPLPPGRNAAETLYAADAVGYLHMNCGHCHNPESPVFNSSEMQLRLTVGALASWPATVVYTSSIGVGEMDNGAGKIIKPQDPDNSVLIVRMNSTNLSVHMPALGSVVVDQTAQTLLRNWINSLPLPVPAQ
jgi:hypothetical protein